MFNRVFHYKPSILGVFPLFFETSIICLVKLVRDRTRPKTPKWWFSEGNPLFQGNLGWWNIIVWPDMYHYIPALPETIYSPLKIGHPKKEMSCSNQRFSRAMLVSGRVHMIDLYSTICNIRTCTMHTWILRDMDLSHDGWDTLSLYYGCIPGKVLGIQRDKHDLR